MSKIDDLATDVAKKRERYTMLGMMNQPSDEIARMKSQMEYEIAYAELLEAESALRHAIREQNVFLAPARP